MMMSDWLQGSLMPLEDLNYIRLGGSSVLFTESTATQLIPTHSQNSLALPLANGVISLIGVPGKGQSNLSACITFDLSAEVLQSYHHPLCIYETSTMSFSIRGMLRAGTGVPKQCPQCGVEPKSPNPGNTTPGIRRIK